MNFKIEKNLVFSSGDPELTLDLYHPQNNEEDVPCIMVIQGGGFRQQDGQRFKPFAEHLAKNGFAAALISYRGLPKHTYLDSVADTKAAVRYMRKVSGDYGIDPDRICVMGRSAGATLAVLLGVTGGESDLEGKGGNDEYSSRVHAVVGIAGVYDFIGRFSDPAQMKMEGRLQEKIKTNGEWIGAPFSLENAHWKEASAINHLDPEDPPILLMHCKDDPIVPWQQSRDLNLALEKLKIPTELLITEKGGHGGPGDSMKLMVEFFRKHLSELP